MESSLLAVPQRYEIQSSEFDNSFTSPFGDNPAKNLLKGFDGFEPVEDDGTGLNVSSFLIFSH